MLFILFLFLFLFLFSHTQTHTHTHTHTRQEKEKRIKVDQAAGNRMQGRRKQLWVVNTYGTDTGGSDVAATLTGLRA